MGLTDPVYGSERISTTAEVLGQRSYKKGKRIVSFEWAAKALAYRLYRVWLRDLEGDVAARRAGK